MENKNITSRQRVESVLRGGHSNKIPFTIYECKIPQSVTERELRNRGLCIVNRRSVFSTRRPNVKVHQEIIQEENRQLMRTSYETPVGTLSTLTENIGFTTWVHEKMFKSPDDYKAILFLINDEVYVPIYEDFANAVEMFGEDVICRAGFGLEPMQALITGTFIDMTTFCYEWMDRQDEILKLYNALVEKRREIYPLVALSPASHANYGGNVVPSIVNLEMFAKYYVPHYDEAAEIMHKHGKLIGCHFDDNCRLLSSLIAETDLDYIEAFTPSPDTDMTLAEARDAWPNKVLWLNFPSSLHLQDNAKVEEHTGEMLKNLKNIDGIIMGITEDMPPQRGLESCRAIMDGLDAHAQSYTTLYV